MQLEYRKELNKSYFIIGEMSDAPEFILQMLVENHINGLLDSSIRTFNGERKLYFDQTGKQCLSGLIQIRNLDDKDLKNIFTSLLLVIEELNVYFLNPSGLMLNTEHIFFKGSEYYFSYDPTFHDSIEMNMASFAESLLSYINHDNELAVVLAYQFYKLTKQEGLTAVNILYDLVGNNAEKTSETKQSQKTGTVNEAAENLIMPVEPDIDIYEDVLCKSDDCRSKHKSLPRTGKDDLITLLLFLMLIIGSAGYFVYRYLQTGVIKFEYELTNKNGILAIIFLILGLLGTISFLLFHTCTGSNSDSGNISENTENTDHIADCFDYYCSEQFEVFKVPDGKSASE